MLCYGAFWAEFLAAKAMDAGPTVDVGQFPADGNGLCRADMSAFAATDACGGADGRPWADGMLDYGTPKPSGKAAVTTEQQIALAGNSLKIRNDKPFPVTADGEGVHCFGNQATLQRSFQGRDVAALQADEGST